MKYLTIEFKWALIFSSVTVLWGILEKLCGLHGPNIAYHMYLTNLFAIPAIWIMVLALKAKRKEDFAGEMSYSQGLLSGLLLSTFIAVMSFAVQWMLTSVISPEYFPNMINHSIDLGIYADSTSAEKAFNYSSYSVQGAFGALAMGVLTTAIAMIFLRSKKN
jgi:hypothetical protein